MGEKGGKGRFDPLLTIWRDKDGLVGLEGRLGEVVGSTPFTNKR